MIKAFRSAQIDPPLRRQLLVFQAKSLAGVVFTALLFFLPAGTADWYTAWAYLVVFAVVPVIMPWIADPQLVVDRDQRNHAGEFGWDKVVFGLFGLVTGLLLPVTAGLDVRFGLTRSINPLFHVLGFGLLCAGWALHLWAMGANPFFTRLVRMQPERGQSTMMGGPYRFIRHPGYAAALVMAVGYPFLFGSLYVALPALLSIVLMVIRTALEDHTLIEELPGYPEYAMKVKYRLAPWIW